MTLPSNGITAEVIREIMPPYHLSGGLLEATFTALPPPPPDPPATWRRGSRRRSSSCGNGRMRSRPGPTRLT